MSQRTNSVPFRGENTRHHAVRPPDRSHTRFLCRPQTDDLGHRPQIACQVCAPEAQPLPHPSQTRGQTYPDTPARALTCRVKTQPRSNHPLPATQYPPQAIHTAALQMSPPAQLDRSLPQIRHLDRRDHDVEYAEPHQPRRARAPAKGGRTLRTDRFWVVIGLSWLHAF